MLISECGMNTDNSEILIPHSEFTETLESSTPRTLFYI